MMTPDLADTQELFLFSHSKQNLSKPTWNSSSWDCNKYPSPVGLAGDASGHRQMHCSCAYSIYAESCESQNVEGQHDSTLPCKLDMWHNNLELLSNLPPTFASFPCQLHHRVSSYSHVSHHSRQSSLG